MQTWKAECTPLESILQKDRINVDMPTYKSKLMSYPIWILGGSSRCQTEKENEPGEGEAHYSEGNLFAATVVGTEV
ncbi:MAG: hypothetical protein Q9211_003273 [Gyalolechia sp. 1 TL-2023]